MSIQRSGCTWKSANGNDHYTAQMPRWIGRPRCRYEQFDRLNHCSWLLCELYWCCVHYSYNTMQQRTLVGPYIKPNRSGVAYLKIVRANLIGGFERELNISENARGKNIISLLQKKIICNNHCREVLVKYSNNWFALEIILKLVAKKTYFARVSTLSSNFPELQTVFIPLNPL